MKSETRVTGATSDWYQVSLGDLRPLEWCVGRNRHPYLFMEELAVAKKKKSAKKKSAKKTAKKKSGRKKKAKGAKKKAKKAKRKTKKAM